ncbi:MAG: hypothetical protein QW041_00445 [Candidatus Pacearchaeota archaeon]
MKNLKIKLIALIFCLMLSLTTVSSALALQIPFDVLSSANAQTQGTCIIDNSRRYFCNESIPESQCYLFRAGRSVDEVEECKLGTCVPLEEGRCISNIERIKCEYNNAGKWYSSAKENVADCNIGCCVAPNKASCEMEEKASCEKKGYNWSSKSEEECKLICGAVEYGCCNEAGVFTNKHRQECNGRFYGNGIYCSQVIGSGIQACKDIRPGDGSTDNDKYDCYCYDSSGKREMIASSVKHVTAEGETNIGSGDCNENEICKDNDGVMGEPAYCGSTSCIDYCPNCEPSNLKNGESICANVNLGFFNPEMRSKALQNWIIMCQNGEIKVDSGFDPQAKREKICIEKIENGLKTTKVIANKWEECQKCGDNEKLLDILGYMPIVGGTALFLLHSIGIADACQGDSGLRIGDKCSDMGKTNVDGKTIQMCDGGRGEFGILGLTAKDEYDHDLWAPIGSCNPIYPPGRDDTCNKCGFGNGGDPLTNPCTEEECNHLGDCQFYPDEGILSQGVMTAGMTAIGTAVGFYSTCKIAGALGWGVCENSAANLMKEMFSTNPNMYYWALYSIAMQITGAGAAQANIKEQHTELTENSKIPLRNGIIVARAVEYSPTLLFGDAVTLAADVLLLKNKGFNIEYKGKKLGIASEKLNKILNVVGIFVNIYYAGRAMNTGKCKAESPYSWDEKKELGLRCEDCGWGEGQPFCTRERCNVLGADPSLGDRATCIFIPKDGKAYGECKTKAPDDVTAPEITYLKIEYFDSTKKKISEDSRTPSINRREELPFNTTYIKISVKTNEPAKCAYLLQENERMTDSNFLNDSYYPLEHVTDYLNFSRNILPATFTYYIKCKDPAGNSQSPEDDRYFIRFKVAGGPDTVAPILEYIDPQAFMPEGTKTINLKVLAYDSNGVSECKYYTDTTENIMTRQTGQRCMTSAENKCDMFTAQNVLLNCTEFTLGNTERLGLTGEKLQAFLSQQKEFRGTKVCPLTIKCKDSKGNEAEFNNSITITSMFNLTIWDITDKYDRTPIFNVSTSRATVCTYEISNKKYDFNDPVYGIKEHVIEHNETLLPRNTPYRITVECKDIAGTKRKESKDFTVLLDSSPPEIVRAYSDGMILHIATNEKAICVFSTKDCNYEFDEGTGMPEARTIPEITHETIFRKDISYYIKCKDEWENKPAGCTAIIKPYEIATI